MTTKGEPMTNTMTLPGPVRWAIVDHGHDLDGRPYEDELTTEELITQLGAISHDAVASAFEIGCAESIRIQAVVAGATAAIRARHHQTAVRWLAQLQIDAHLVEVSR